jgi:hypothetical protein
MTAGVVVRVDRRTRQVITKYIGAVVSVLVGVAIASQTKLVRHPRPPADAATFAIAAVAVGAFAVLRLNRNRVVLYDDGIEVVRYPWRPRRLARLDIATRHFHPGGWRQAPYHILVTREGESVKLPPYLENNAALRAWLKDVPPATSS